MAKLTFIDADALSSRGRPWTIRLEYHGANAANASGVSAKFWYATGRAKHEPVEIGWGAIGAKPQLMLEPSWADFHARVLDKQAKGYVWADTPYVRMSAGNLAKVINPSAVMMAPKAPKPVAAPAPKPVAAPVVATPTSTPPPALMALGQPFSLICALKVIFNGVKLTGYKALDAAGDELLEMTKDDGLKFAQDYGVDIRFV